MTKLGTAVSVANMPAHLRILAELLLRPAEFNRYVQNGYVQAIRLGWELTGTLLQGPDAQFSQPGRPGFPVLCLGYADTPRYALEVVSKVMGHAQLRGWELLLQVDYVKGDQGPQPVRLVGMDRMFYPPGSRVLNARLVPHDTQYTCAKTRRVPVPNGTAIPQRVLMSGTSIAFLHQQSDGMSVFNLVWMIVQALLMGHRKANFGSAAKFLYSDSDWQSARVVFASRGWILHHDQNRTTAFVEPEISGEYP